MPRAAADPTLLERDAELSALARHADDATAGRGSLVLVEGPPGGGKTALLRRVRSDLRERGLRTLGAVGGELEREFVFGVVRQLLEPVVLPADDERRARLLAGAAARAAPLFGADDTAFGPSADAGFATLHGLYWLVVALADDAPLAIVVDDAHWADAASLRFLDFLARRVAELPVLVVVALRPTEPGAEDTPLAGLADAPDVVVLRPAPLSPVAVRALVDDGLDGHADDAVVHGAIDATRGNPLLVRELVRSLAAHDGPPDAATVGESVPAAVARSVARRVGRLSADARGVARALAVLGDRHDVALLAAATGTDDAVVRAALGTLRDAELVDGDPPAYLHPLVRQAVADPVRAIEREALHRAAAEALHRRDPDDDEVVVHLLAAPPLGADWVVPVLRRSAARATAAGAPDAAARRLARAVEERGLAGGEPGGPDVQRLRHEHGLAAAAAGDPDGRTQLALAARGPDPRTAASATADQVWLGHFGPDDDVGAMVARLRAGLGAAEGDAAVEDALRARIVDALLVEVARGPERAPELAAAPDPPGPRMASHLAWDAAAGDATADEVASVAAIALRDRPFADLRTVEQPTPMWALLALCAAGSHEDADRAIRDAEEALRAGAGPLGRGMASLLRAEWLVAFGAADVAATTAGEAAELLARAGSGSTAASAAASLGQALVRRGDLDGAERTLAALGPDARFETWWGGGSVWSARAELRAAQGRWGDAVEDLRRVGRLAEDHGWRRFPRGTHAADLARALVGAGRADEAIPLAAAEASDAARRGAVDAQARALVAQGLALGGDEGLQALTAAVEAAEASSSLRLRALAALELGAALRRDARRVDARGPLAAARDLAHRAAEPPLVERATEELTIAGGRPRRIALSGADALTPGERRVAEHAARGLTNREIAETLFVTRKTVEYQLGACYGKLGIRSRTQLADALAPDA